MCLNKYAPIYLRDLLTELDNHAWPARWLITESCLTYLFQSTEIGRTNVMTPHNRNRLPHSLLFTNTLLHSCFIVQFLSCFLCFYFCYRICIIIYLLTDHVFNDGCYQCKYQRQSAYVLNCLLFVL